jgi:transposase-like protein
MSNWNAEYARAVLERADRAGLSTAELAEELDVSPRRIQWWRARLAKSPARSPKPPKPPEFVEVAVAAPTPERPFVVRVGGARAVEVWPGFDAAELERLLSVVVQPC